MGWFLRQVASVHACVWVAQRSIRLSIGYVDYVQTLRGCVDTTPRVKIKNVVTNTASGRTSMGLTTLILNPFYFKSHFCPISETVATEIMTVKANSTWRLCEYDNIATWMLSQKRGTKLPMALVIRWKFSSPILPEVSSTKTMVLFGQILP